MNGEEIKIAKLLDEILLNNDFIKNLSKSYVSEFIDIGDSKFIRLFQSNSKLGVDFLFPNLETADSNNQCSILKTYLFNERGYLESSYNLNIEIIYNNSNIVETYTKIGPDLEAGSELEEIRNIALEHYKEYNCEREKFLQSWEKKNKGLIKLFRKIFKIDNSPLELDEPNSDEYFKIKDLVNTIINKQLSFSKLENDL